VYVCVYAHTHTHTAEHSGVSPGVGMRHLKGPENPDGLNLGICVFVFCTKYTCVCICKEAESDPGLTVFFLLHIVSSEKKKQM